MGIVEGSKVKMHYVGTLEDGTEFDNSHKRGEPLEFEAGAGHLIVGIDEALLGMEKGDRKTLKIPPEKAYGERDEQAVKPVPKTAFGGSGELPLGATVGVSLPDGRNMPAVVKAITIDEITLDFNHPLAGHTLNFEIEVVELQVKP
jgi:FKBP-type peptidyl-prolyl cis-trans isomerase 2